MKRKIFTMTISLFVCLAYTTGFCFVSRSPQILETRNWKLETDVGMSDWEKDKLFLDFFKGSVFEDEVRQIMVANGSLITFDAKKVEEMFWMVASMVVGGGMIQSAEQAATTLYRAVSAAELQSIQNTGQFKIVQQSVENGKYFTSSYNEAVRYGNMAEKAFVNDGAYSIIKTTIPTKNLPNVFSVDGGIPSYIIQNPTLKTLKPVIMQ